MATLTSQSYSSCCEVVEAVEDVKAVTPQMCKSSSNRIKKRPALLQRTLHLTVICLLIISILPNVLAMTQEEKNELR